MGNYVGLDRLAKESDAGYRTFLLDCIWRSRTTLNICREHLRHFEKLSLVPDNLDPYRLDDALRDFYYDCIEGEQGFIKAAMQKLTEMYQNGAKK